jgi:hypothetical protein
MHLCTWAKKKGRMRLTPLSLSGTKQSNGHTTAPKTHTQTGTGGENKDHNIKKTRSKKQVVPSAHRFPSNPDCRYAMGQPCKPHLCSHSQLRHLLLQPWSACFYLLLFALNHIKMPPKLARQMAMCLPDAQALRYHCASADVIQLTEEKLICQFIIGIILHISDVFLDQ